MSLDGETGIDLGAKSAMHVDMCISEKSEAFTAHMFVAVCGQGKRDKGKKRGGVVVVCWLLNVPATCLGGEEGGGSYGRE